MCKDVVEKYDVFFKPQSVLFFLHFTEEGITGASKSVNISQTRGRTYIQKFMDGGLVEREYRGVYRLTDNGRKLKQFFEKAAIDSEGGFEIVKR